MKKELISDIKSNNKDNNIQNIPYIQKIKNLMEFIITQNNNNKKYKISLFKIRGFEPSSLFYEIDNISSGFINQRDLVEYLSKNNILIEKHIINLFIREYNKQENDNNLSIHDFIQFINFDIDKTSLDIGVLDFDKNKIKKLFLNLIESELNIIKEKNLLISEIIKIGEFSTFETFYKISNDKNYIDLDSLKIFLDNKFNKNEVKELIYRIDMNNDGRITYDEFQDLFFPFQKHLNIGQTDETEIYNFVDDNNYNILLNYNNDFNLNSYKDNILTVPKIIYNYNENENENENDIIDNNSKSDIFLSKNPLDDNKVNVNERSANSEIILSDNQFYQNDLIDENFLYDQNKLSNSDINNNKFRNYNFRIKYDEKLFNEINDRIKGRIKNEDDIDFDKYKDKNIHDNSNTLEKNKNNLYHNSSNFYGDKNDDDLPYKKKGNKKEENNSSSSQSFLGKIRNPNYINNLVNEMNISNKKNEEKITDSKSDIFISKNYSGQNNNYIDNNYKNNINVNDHINLQNFEDEFRKKEEQDFNKNNNFADILTDKDKIIIDIFIDFINSVTLLENKTENMRETITLCNDISLLGIFETFDLNKNNLISKKNFIDICKKEYNIFPTEFQIKLIYDRFDLDKDDELNFNEFMSMISPLNKQYLELCNKEEDEKINKMVSFESKKNVIHFLKTLIDNETYIYDLKNRLISDKNFNFIDLWGILMKFSYDNQILTKGEFNNFLENFGCYLTQYELDILFFKLSKDNEIIKYDDLYKEILI